MNSASKIILVLIATAISATLCGCSDNLKTYRCIDNSTVTAPVVLLSNTSDLHFKTRHCLAQAGAAYFLSNGLSNYPVEINATDNCTEKEVSLARAPSEAGYYDLVAECAGVQQLIAKRVVRVIDKFNIVLSFDDGPAVDKLPEDGCINDSSTMLTLENLAKFRHGPENRYQGVCAIFFILSQPDKFLKFDYNKAETRDGCLILQEIKKYGHVIGVHWGGNYYSQLKLHTSRVHLPPYKWSESAENIGNNALESDLLECINRIRECTQTIPEYVRPPLWKYSSKKDPSVKGLVLQSYKNLGLKMILSDGRYPDGGYGIISFVCPWEMSKFEKNLRLAFTSGESDLVLSMHDSNSYTAKRLPQILAKIYTEFARIDFGGAKADGHERIVFARNAEQVKNLLERKTRFVMFPGYSPDKE